MITLAIVGGATLVTSVVAGGLFSLRRRRVRLDPIGNDVVYMDEEVLREFLHAEFERNVAAQEAERSAKAADAKATKLANAANVRSATSKSPSRRAERGSSRLARSSSEVTDRPAADASVGALGSERVIPSYAGGATAVAGPPTDLADEGWARDPQGRHEWRYFDSGGWSDFVLDGDNVDTDPLLTGAVG